MIHYNFFFNMLFSINFQKCFISFYISTDENIEQKTGEKSKEDGCVVEDDKEEGYEEEQFEEKRLNRQYKKKL